MKHVIRPAAREDILRQISYYLQEGSPDAAARFLDAVDASIATICARPAIGTPKAVQNPTLSGLRSWPVKDFEQISIYYLVLPESLRVIRILHGRRDLKAILEQEPGDGVPH